MVRILCRNGPAYCNRGFVLLKGKQSHVTHNGCVDRQERIAWTETLRLLQGLQPALRLATTRKRISKAGMAKSKIGIEFDALQRMHYGQVRVSAPRESKPEHQMCPVILIIECHRPAAGIERLTSKRADRRARIKIEHVQIRPS